MKTSSSEYNTKCIVHECNNRMWEGEFVGQLCKPCYLMLTTGELVPSTSFVARLFRERDELKAYADKLADGLPEGILPKDVENLRNANAGLAEDLRKAKLERGEALAALRQTCATNTEIRRELEEARQEAERYRRKTLSQDAEIAKLKASSNENYWELSRQRGNMLYALHKIADAVRYGFKHGSKSGEEMK